MIRRMEKADVPEVAAMEAECFHVPWSEKLLYEGLENSFDWFMVLEEQGVITGYCVLRILADEGEIQRIAVLPQYRRQGYGRKLMDAMETAAKNNHVEAVTLEVRAGNQNAVNLYKSYGFETEGVRRGYYTNPTEDAFLMWKRGISSNSQIKTE